MKKVIRLTENDIHKIVKNSVKRILKENVTNAYGDEFSNEGNLLIEILNNLNNALENMFNAKENELSFHSQDEFKIFNNLYNELYLFVYKYQKFYRDFLTRK